MQGLVIRSTGSWYTVRTKSEIVECKLKGNFRIRGIRTTNPIAVGDKVIFEHQTEKGIGLISDILDRTNVIIRKSTNLSKASHILAANVDQLVVIVTPAFPRTSTGFIDRVLVAAASFHVPAIVVINKNDLWQEELIEWPDLIHEVYESAGYQVLKVSALNGYNIDKLKEILENKVSLISGHSGVGKSSLMNALDAKLNLKTGALSIAHLKGKHTTTYAEMLPLSFGGYIIDTPGIKEFGIVDFEPWELGHWYPDFTDYIPNCKYKNCTHQHEPDCAVIAALELHKIHPVRYNNYLGILRNVEDAEDEYGS